MRLSYAKRVTQPADQCRSFKVDSKSLPRIGKGEGFFFYEMGEGKGVPLSRGCRQRDLKNDPLLPPITPWVVAGPTLIETSFQYVSKMIRPWIRKEKSVSHKARRDIS